MATTYAEARGQTDRALSIGFVVEGGGVWCHRVTRGQRIEKSYRVTWGVRGRGFNKVFRDRETAAAFAAEKVPAVLQTLALLSESLSGQQVSG